jgi:hypothetical protein
MSEPYGGGCSAASAARLCLGAFSPTKVIFMIFTMVRAPAKGYRNVE